MASDDARKAKRLMKRAERARGIGFGYEAKVLGRRASKIAPKVWRRANRDG